MTHNKYMNQFIRLDLLDLVTDFKLEIILRENLASFKHLFLPVEKDQT